MSENTMAGGGSIESREDYKDTARGQYEYWCDELGAAERQVRHWHRQATRIVKRYLDNRSMNNPTVKDNNDTSRVHRLNLFHSNVTTLLSMLYGNLPKVDVSRRFADPEDDISRVASEILERMLNNNIEEDGDQYNSVLRGVLQDRLLSGLGVARCRYEVETEETTVTIEGPQGEELEMSEERVVSEDAPIDYFHWQDVLWGWARTWADIPWIGYRSWLTRDEVTKRFGESVAQQLTYKRQRVSDERDLVDDEESQSAWQKAEIWEIWDKTTRNVYFVSKGYDKVLEERDDPLGLTNFFPSPPFFIANPTTSLFMPTPDFHMAQDLYNQIDLLQTRIDIITEAVKVVGVYDSEAGDSVGRMLKEGSDNVLIPVKSWAMFGEKGGLDGAIDWMPLQDIVNALDKLRDLRQETIELLYQVTGMSEVLRGASGGQYEGVGQAQLKAKFGSVRVQALQDSFAQFASDLLALKAEIIARHFDPETIAKAANIENTFDAQLAGPAIQLIKNPDSSRMRIVIRPESVAMVDYAQLKAERTEFVQALALFLQSSAPMLEQDKSMMPFLLQLMQWGMAGFKGAQEVEGVMDRAIKQAQEKAAQPEQDPQQQQMQMQQQLEQMKAQIEIQKIQAKAQADMQTREQDKQADIETAMAQHQAKLAEIEAEMQATLAETKAKVEADLIVEQAQAQANVAQTQAAAASEVQKDAIETELELQKEAVKTGLKIDEIAASSAAKIKEAKQTESEDKEDAEK